VDHGPCAYTHSDSFFNNANEALPLPICNFDLSYLQIVMPGPLKLWWPTGYGEPNRYAFMITFTPAPTPQGCPKTGVDAPGPSTTPPASNDSVTFTRKIGIRTVEIVKEKIPTGETFYFRINGIPVFAKGDCFT
jgi:hypothetical protein